MKIFMVMRDNPEYAVVNDDLEIVGGPPEEVEEVFLSKENAERCKDLLEEQTKELSEKFGCDMDEYFIVEREVQ